MATSVPLLRFHNPVVNSRRLDHQPLHPQYKHLRLLVPRKKALSCLAPKAQSCDTATELELWLKRQGLPDQAASLRSFGVEGVGLVATRELQSGDIAISIPENYTVTSVDVANHPVVSRLSEGKDDLIGLTLWLVYESSLKDKSPWYPYLRTFPTATMSPLLWTEAEQEELLNGSPVLGEVKRQVKALNDVFQDVKKESTGGNKFNSDALTFEVFKAAFSAILSRVVYLPSADLFALVPFADLIRYKGSYTFLDYEMQGEQVILRVDRNFKPGDEIFASRSQDLRNSDMLIRYGEVDASNPNDYVTIETGLVATDPLRLAKQEILLAAGLNTSETFPLYADCFPIQLLTFTRLSRIQDPALFPKVKFDQDDIISQANEYETLMLLMGECRVRLSAYGSGLDDDIRLLNRQDLSHKERISAQLRLSEKRILTNTMSALRNRLAPIRGIPTKEGFKDPNSDIKEIFDMVEQVASAPGKFLSNLFPK